VVSVILGKWRLSPCITSWPKSRIRSRYLNFESVNQKTINSLNLSLNRSQKSEFLSFNMLGDSGNVSLDYYDCIKEGI
jgi:hypothetical protein